MRLGRKHKKDRGLTREEISQLYKDVRSTMQQMQEGKGIKDGPYGPTPSKTGESKAESKLVASAPSPVEARPMPKRASHIDRGQVAAVGLVMLFSLLKVVISLVEGVGLVGTEMAQASLEMAATKAVAINSAPGNFSKDEVQLLTTLDQRRSELDDRQAKIKEHEEDLDKREREFVVRLAELRELTGRLKQNREVNDTAKSKQLEQLANVYGSMNPNEAATLIEQLDITIGLELLRHMPEKRIGQILALMSPQKALAITKLLSGK